MTDDLALHPDGAAPASPPSDVGHGLARTLGDRVYLQLVEAITKGALPQGSKIREHELAARFGVSRGPLREAIRRLEERRLVTRTAHVGARVMELSREGLIELFTVREALEGMAARLAAERMTDGERADLLGLLDAHDRAIGDGDRYDQSDHDFDFHYRLVRSARNELIETILCRDLYQLVQVYRHRHAAAPGRARRALAEHRRIAEAIVERDGELAELHMRRHMAAARAILADIIERERRAMQEDNMGGDR